MRVAPKVEEVPLILFFCLIGKYSGNFLTPKFSQKMMGNFLENCIQNFPPKNHQKFLDEIFLFIFLELTLIYYLQVGISFFKLFLGSVLKNAAT